MVKEAEHCTMLGNKELVVVLLLYFFICVCACLCVFMSLPEGAMGWSGICECGISWSYPFLLHKDFCLSNGNQWLI